MQQYFLDALSTILPTDSAEETVFVNVVERTGRHFGDGEAVEGIFAVRAPAVIRAGLPVFDAGTTVVLTAATASATCLKNVFC